MGIPTAASYQPGSFDVFATDSDTNLFHWALVNGGGWANPENIGQGSSPCAISWQATQLGYEQQASKSVDVFANRADGTIQHWWYDGLHREGPHLLGDSQGCSAVGATSWGVGRLDVFAVNSDFSPLHWWFDDNGGDGWGTADTSLADAMTERYGNAFQVSTMAPPAAASFGGNTLEVVATANGGGDGNDILHWRFYIDNRRRNRSGEPGSVLVSTASVST